VFFKFSRALTLSVFFLSLLFACLQPSYADESLDGILAQHVIHEPVKLAYQEVRYIQFVDEPVTSTGFLYVSGSYVILEKKEPSRLIMATNHINMWLYDVEQNVKRKRNIRRFSNKDTALGALLHAVRTGDNSMLTKHYQVTVSEKDRGWKLNFSPIKKTERDANITIRGPKGHTLDVLESAFIDGNHTTWELKKVASGDKVKLKMKSLVEQAGGW